ncbi:MAG TPA: hypothetical protein PLM56_13180 [Cyclobacteriaceae bacterium]|nr:hypothetical protein [Cytophagales bacterium]HRE65914.1 hypothetical protein [Cyclobacteriaceae bacterium]HRF34451.1 hypothetical protein [Cyclobacteriaceae bacterium]
MKLSRTIALLLICINPLVAQVEQLNRYELLLNDRDDNESFRVASLEEDGLLIYRKLIMPDGDRMHLIKIDTTLAESWQGYIGMDKNLSVSHIRVKDKVAFILFKSSTFISGNFQLLASNVSNGNYRIYNIENFIPFNPTEFIVTDEGAMLGGYFNYRPLVLFYNFSTGRARVLPGFFNEPGELNQVKQNPDGSVDVVVSAKNYERKKSLWIRNYSASGDLIKTTVIEPDGNKNLIFGRSVKMPNNAQVVAGVYGGRDSNYSRGLFVAEINPAGEYKTTYYNFGDLQNFFSYMKANRERRTKERIERRKIKGKKVRFSYRFLVHEVVPYENQYVMLGEAFYPRYTFSNARVGTLGYYGNPMMRADRVFDGYQYTHAVIIGFDNNGELIWDNSFEINDVKTFELQQFVKIAPEHDRITLLYLHNNLIRSKTIKGNQVLEGKTADPMKARFDFDLVKERDTEKSKLDYWYPEHFYASGVQIVRNQLREGTYRKVFFINKLKYQ